jgi:hypothetical protein
MLHNNRCENLKSYIYTYIVAYLLKARTVEREKQPLLANGFGNNIRC